MLDIIMPRPHKGHYVTAIDTFNTVMKPTSVHKLEQVGPLSQAIRAAKI